MSTELISPTFLFRLSVGCVKTTQKWSKKGVQLDESHMIPSFRAELDKGPRFADFRMGWNAAGLLITLRTAGKKQEPWCRDSRLEDSDGISLWIDTRDTKSIHRASRFCHRFVFLPGGTGKLLAQPVAAMIGIHRAKELPKPVADGTLQVLSKRNNDGYELQAFLPGTAITGWDPNEHPRVGFFYAVTDRELGWQTFSLGPEFPFSSDPSLWGSLELRA